MKFGVQTPYLSQCPPRIGLSALALDEVLAMLSPALGVVLELLELVELLEALAGCSGCMILISRSFFSDFFRDLLFFEAGRTTVHLNGPCLVQTRRSEAYAVWLPLAN